LKPTTARLISKIFFAVTWTLLIVAALQPSVHEDDFINTVVPVTPSVNLTVHFVALHRGHAIVKTGIHSVADLYRIILSDPEAARHYAGFNLDKAYMTTLQHSVLAFISFRVDGKGIFWSTKPELLRTGEQVLTDGASYIRARCGNRIAFAPQAPTNTQEEIPEMLTETTPPPGVTYQIYNQRLPRIPTGSLPKGPVASASLPSNNTVVLIALALALLARFILRKRLTKTV